MGSADYRFLCRECRVGELDGECPNAVTLQVPVRDRRSGEVCEAVVRCELSPSGHHLELVATRDRDGHPLFLEDEAMDALLSKIDAIERRRLCGTEGVCPQAVVEVARRR